MTEAATECGALGEAVVFLSHFRDLPDPRQAGKVLPLEEILLLCLLAVLAGAETFVDIARFGQKKLELLRRFRPFSDGTPSHDHLGDIFATYRLGYRPTRGRFGLTVPPSIVCIGTGYKILRY